MKFQDGQRIVFIGDSITESGRNPSSDPLGSGYVRLIRDLVTAKYPDRSLEWFNRGVSGETSRDLASRWQADAIDLAPDWLSIMVGTNDVGRKYRGKPDEAVPLDEYVHRLRELAQRAMAVTGCGLIIAAPYVIETHPDEPRLAETRQFATAALQVADELGAIPVATQDAFDVALKSRPPSEWSEDRIHPNQMGHAIIALTYLRAVGFAL